MKRNPPQRAPPGKTLKNFRDPFGQANAQRGNGSLFHGSVQSGGEGSNGSAQVDIEGEHGSFKASVQGGQSSQGAQDGKQGKSS